MLDSIAVSVFENNFGSVLQILQIQYLRRAVLSIICNCATNAMDLPAADTKVKRSHSSNQKTVSRICTASENDAVQTKIKNNLHPICTALEDKVIV